MNTPSEEFTEPAQEAPPAETDLPTGEQDGIEPQEAVETEPEYDLLEVDDPTAKYVKVSVDGEETVVPLDEALQGYSRQADYTRKTQGLAEERRTHEDDIRLSQAFRANPAMTVQILAQQAGVSVEEYLGIGQAGQAQQEPASEEYVDPLERQLAEERQARETLEARIDQRESDDVLRKAIGGLQSQFGANDDDARAVVSQAYNMGLGPEAFPMIFQSLQYQKATAAYEQRQQRTKQRQTSAQAATQVVATGSGAVGHQPAPEDGRLMTVAEAANMAFDELEAR